MSTPNPTKRKPSGSPAVKLLITTASITAVLSGWAVFSLQTPESAPTTQVQVAEVSLILEPIPTVIPHPQTTTVLSLTQPQPPNAPQPQKQASLPALRKVHAPKVVTITRSSR